jgi:WhiB family redox-sensing transcriptional regulator
MEAFREYETLATAIKNAPDIPACMQTDPEVFFPDGNNDGWNETRKAKKMCESCPVIYECAIYALAAGENYGVWGGLSANELRQIRRGHRSLALRPRSATKETQPHQTR